MWDSVKLKGIEMEILFATAYVDTVAMRPNIIDRKWENIVLRIDLSGNVFDLHESYCNITQ